MLVIDVYYKRDISVTWMGWEEDKGAWYWFNDVTDCIRLR
jgi:glucan-binding YG repeat protein